MNPQFHEEFVALSALHHAGETTDEEWALLQVHMAYCDSCREKFLQYEQLLASVVPEMALVAANRDETIPEESGLDFTAAQAHLMAQLEQSSPGHKDSSNIAGGWSTMAYIAAGLSFVAGIGGLYFISGRSKQTQAVDSNFSPAVIATIQSQATVPRSVEQSPTANRENSNQGPRLRHVEDQLQQTKLALADATKKLNEREDQQKQWNAEKETLNLQVALTRELLEAERAKLASAGSQEAQLKAAVATLETKVVTLNAVVDEKEVALSEKDRMLALDKDFLAHDKDIRDLIGARNLYIADIMDTTETGKTARQFGRLFYTQDRSLVFYGFDLDKQAGHNKDVSYQVWGNSSDHSAPVSLGLFYQDDANKRWVLRSNDAKTLSRLDMVFVTVEPLGGSKTPTGKQLLRALLQIQPNHP